MIYYTSTNTSSIDYVMELKSFGWLLTRIDSHKVSTSFPAMLQRRSSSLSNVPARKSPVVLWHDVRTKMYVDIFYDRLRYAFSSAAAAMAADKK